MASAAHTLAPYSGWARPRLGSSLQSDDVVTFVGDITISNFSALIGPVEDLQLTEAVNRDQFLEAYQQWLADSMFDSLPDQIKAHPSYQAIVAMGDRAVPIIAAELRKEPSFLFLALEDITGEDPVPDEAQGDLSATVNAWLSWLRK